VALGERSRNPFMARSTAEGAASLRAAGALEPDPAVRCPDEMAGRFLGGLNGTTLAKRRLTRPLYLLRVNRLIPGAYAYEIGRCKFIDEIVRAEAGVGLDELVLLGAGLDSRPYRLAEELRGVRVLEVDHPASQTSKRARLRRVLDREPDHVRYVPVDFTRDDLPAALAAAGHDEDAATLFVWSGVSPYLPGEAVAAVLSWVGRHRSPRTSIVFDAAWAEAVDGTRDYYGAAELRRAVAAVGEPLRWGIPEGQVDETLERFGLRVERVADEATVTSSYLTRSDGTPFDRPFGFGVLVHARVASRGE
jgi:methyltransferase (TIGR00027 family)